MYIDTALLNICSVMANTRQGRVLLRMRGVALCCHMQGLSKGIMIASHAGRRKYH